MNRLVITPQNVPADGIITADCPVSLYGLKGQHINRIKTSANGPEVAGGHACNLRALFAAVMAVASSLRRYVVGSSEMSKSQAG